MATKYFCWFEVRESYSEIGESFEQLDEKCAAISAWIDLSSFTDLDSTGASKLYLTIPNGVPMIVGCGVVSRSRGERDELLSLLEFLAVTTPGTYGFLYMLDIGMATHESSWEVHVVKRGAVHEYKDSLFALE